MAHPHLDYSALSPEERLQLVEDIWDSLAVGAPESVPIPEAHARELDRRAAAFRADGDPGRPWREALDGIEAELKRRGG
jgi:putative addiction module component (TIGR02574 family)